MRRTVGVLVDGLLDHPLGQRVDVALIAGNGEVVELRDRSRLARSGRDRQPRPSQPGQERIGVGGPRLPQRGVEVTQELEHDRPGLRDIAVAEPGSGHRERVLVDDLLLEVGSIFLRPPTPGGSDAPHRGELHRSAASGIVTMHQKYRKSVRNHDGSSGFSTGGEAVAGAGQAHLRGMNLSQEDAGLEIGHR